MNARVVCDPDGPSGRIVATIGPPDSRAFADLEEIVGFGTIRINLAFAHSGNYQDMRSLVRRIRSRRGDGVCILLDCVGPRVKLGPLPREGVELRPGAELTVTTRDVVATSELLPTVFDELPRAVKEGQPILLAEGRCGWTCCRRTGSRTCAVVSCAAGASSSAASTCRRPS